MATAMFEKLRRAKSFIHRTKHEEEREKYKDLDFSETSHLRRSIPIDSEVLERQRKLNIIPEIGVETNNRPLRRQVSKSQELLHDQVLEQLRRINFGDSASRKASDKLVKPSEVQSGFKRNCPAYCSERNYASDKIGDVEIRRKSFVVSGCIKGAEKRDESECYAQYRNSDDVLSNFYRRHPAYSSGKDQAASAETTKSINSNEDFLLNRKSVELGRNFDRRAPAYVSDRHLRRPKPDLLEKTGLKSLFHKPKNPQVPEQTLASTNFDRKHLAYYSERNIAHRTASSKVNNNQASKNFEKPVAPTQKVALSGDALARKRTHDQTKTNFDRTRTTYMSERNFSRQGAKNVVDKLKKDGG